MYCKKVIFYISFVLVLFLIVLQTGCNLQTDDNADNEEIKPVAETTFLMGTMVKITIYDKIEDQQIFQKVFDRIAEIEDRMTINKETGTSEIIQLNKTAGKAYSKLSADTFYVLAKGKYYAELSRGLFDITIGPLVKLWNIGTEEAAVPPEKELKKKLSLVKYQNLLLDKDNRSAKLAAPGMIVDLGGIAKGYAADEAAEILEKAGIEHAIINLGGNILALDSKPDGTKFRIGLQNPLEPRGDYMGIIKLSDQALVSSGIYERYFEVNGKRYHHILNPKTGYPEDNAILSISILTGESIDADALSTTIFLLGLDEGMTLIEELPATEVIFITKDKKVYTSSGISEDHFEITNAEFELQQ